MKHGAMLINCARGGIVNEDDLYDALKSNHLGASTHEAQDNVARDVATQIVSFLKTGDAPNIVNQNDC